MSRILADLIILGSFLIFVVPDWVIYLMMIMTFAWEYGKIGQKSTNII